MIGRLALFIVPILPDFNPRIRSLVSGIDMPIHNICISLVSGLLFSAPSQAPDYDHDHKSNLSTRASDIVLGLLF